MVGSSPSISSMTKTDYTPVFQCLYLVSSWVLNFLIFPPISINFCPLLIIITYLWHCAACRLLQLLGLILPQWEMRGVFKRISDALKRKIHVFLCKVFKERGCKIFHANFTVNQKEWMNEYWNEWIMLCCFSQVSAPRTNASAQEHKNYSRPTTEIIFLNQPLFISMWCFR